MFLSKLLLNPDPSARDVRRDLANPYELHRTLMRAFPDKTNGGPGRVLFRLVLPRNTGQPPTVLVQSDKRPDWAPLIALDGYVLGGQVPTKIFEPTFHEGQCLWFRLQANVTIKRNGKRHGLFRLEDQRQWLVEKGKHGGFEPVDFAIRRTMRIVCSAPGKPAAQVHFGADYEGVLRVTDGEAFARALASGIGPAKGFGFGLLSVAPLRASPAG